MIFPHHELALSLEGRRRADEALEKRASEARASESERDEGARRLLKRSHFLMILLAPVKIKMRNLVKESCRKG